MQFSPKLDNLVCHQIIYDNWQLLHALIAEVPTFLKFSMKSLIELLKLKKPPSLVLRDVSSADEFTGTPLTSSRIPPMEMGVFPIAQVSDLGNDSFIHIFFLIPSQFKTIIYNIYITYILFPLVTQTSQNACQHPSYEMQCKNDEHTETLRTKIKTGGCY